MNGCRGEHEQNSRRRVIFSQLGQKLCAVGVTFSRRERKVEISRATERSGRGGERGQLSSHRNLHQRNLDVRTV